MSSPIGSLPDRPRSTLWVPSHLAGLARAHLSSPDAFPARLEKHRKLIVALVGSVYWLLIFEGVLRKWLFPQWSRQLFFIRDPIVILVYVLVFAARTRLPRSNLFRIEWALAVAGAGLCVINLVAGSKLPAYFLLYGWRNYFLYMPLSFIIARYFNLWDLAQLAKRTLIVCIPMAALVLAQLQAPYLAPINAGLGDRPYQVQTTEYGVVRPPGPFTSDQGLTTFSASALAIALAFWLLPRRSRPVGLPLLLASTACTLICVGLSGSRTLMLWSAVIIGGALLGLFAIRSRMWFRASALVLLMLGAAAFLLPIIFPRAIEAFIARWTEAGAAESQAYGEGGVFARLGYEATSFLRVISQTPSAGYGLGSCGNAAWEMGVREKVIFFRDQDERNAAETDWGRNILELGPILGSIFIIFRLTFAATLLRNGLRATQWSDHPFPLMLALFISVLLIYWQITGNGTLNGYAWLFVGFSMAATSKARRFQAYNSDPRFQRA